MRRNSLSTRAHLRSLALLEPYARARTSLLKEPPRSPVVPVASDPQGRLEAEFFGSLRYIYEPATSSLTHDSRLVIERIEAGENYLSLTAESRGLAERLSYGILPEWEADDQVVANGISGLRCRATNDGRGIAFHFPGSPGAVNVYGVSLGELETAQDERLRDVGVRSVRATTGLTPQERNSRIPYRKDTEAASVVARRLGLFMAPNPIAIDSWWTRPGRFSVEIIIDHADLDPRPDLLTRLRADDFAPKLTLKRAYSPADYSVHLALEGTSSELDIRLLRVGRSSTEDVRRMLKSSR